VIVGHVRSDLMSSGKAPQHGMSLIACTPADDTASHVATPRRAVARLCDDVPALAKLPAIDVYVLVSEATTPQ